MGYYTPNVSLLTKRDQVYGEEKDNADENTLKNGGDTGVSFGQETRFHCSFDACV